MRHHYTYITLLEPFQSPNELENYKRRLGMHNANVNLLAKIWSFWNENWEEEDYKDIVQQLTIGYKLRGIRERFKVTAIYARCSAIERLELWEDL
ncbi:hypothetical protein KY290_005690 [Solanum tuberosum]|uniref:Uncharacterized protein n=1 Tax=Solanum tuberosum TaxID=4113 RepID=A0ABQ7WGP3_SOLTU|nr:hypothetical protein KY289_006068 [Solanum tuberosum]KAH0779263.1 hypothetical protein KY290_005690 [Solanum tuberosum]